MNKTITSFVGLDTHIDSIAIGVAPRGRQEPRFVGTVPPQWGVRSKALGRQGKPEALHIVYEAGPCGYTLARHLPAHGYVCEVIAPGKGPPPPRRSDQNGPARCAAAGADSTGRRPGECDDSRRTG